MTSVEFSVRSRYFSSDFFSHGSEERNYSTDVDKENHLDKYLQKNGCIMSISYHQAKVDEPQEAGEEKSTLVVEDTAKNNR